MAEVQTPAGASAKDSALVTLSVLVLFIGIGAFYWYDDRALPDPYTTMLLIDRF